MPRAASLRSVKKQIKTAPSQAPSERGSKEPAPDYFFMPVILLFSSTKTIFGL